MDFVLRPPKSAPANATSTNAATTGVVRDHKPLPLTYAYTVPFAETAADQYRAAILEGSSDTEDYLLWAAQDGSLTLHDALFWWSRNDTHLTRFGWDGQANRWAPLKGTSPRNLGVLQEGVVYTATPRPATYAVGEYLPGDSTLPDVYAVLRVGIRPDASASVPTVLVVLDAEASSTYPFVGATPHAVIGVTNGVVQFNPSYIETYAGQTVWYNAEVYPENSNGELGLLRGSQDLFLSPVPGPQEYPFIRLGSRKYLSATAVDTDADLVVLAVASGAVGWSRSTGKIKLSAVDRAKADPDSVGFDIQYLGNSVYFDGVALSAQPLRTRQPVPLQDGNGSPTKVGLSNALYIPDAEPFPSGVDGVLGLGVSGVEHVADGTGVVPNAGALPGPVPNGCGLVRRMPVLGDSILYTLSGALEEIEVVAFESELPPFPFLIKKGKAVVSLEVNSGMGSRVALGLKDRTRFNNETLYFLQADVQPAYYTTEARIYSRKPGPYTFDGSEVLYFTIDGVAYTWNAPVAGTYTATEIAADITTILTTGSARAVREFVVLEATDVGAGHVEIGFGSTGAFADRDFSGAAALGFLPGWRAESSLSCWLSDNGSSMGMYRSPVNRDRSETTPDFRAYGEFNGVLSKTILPMPTFPLFPVPLQDGTGFEPDEFFTVQDGQYNRRLQHPFSVYYDFGNNRFFWADQEVSTGRLEQTAYSLPLGQTGVFGETLHPAVASTNGLYLAEDGASFVLQHSDNDFLLPSGGAQGVADLIEVVGQEITTGAAGSFQTGTFLFEDANAQFITHGISLGYRLRVFSGDASGSYIVASVGSETQIQVQSDVPFPVSAGPTHGMPYVSWALYEGYPTTGYDPTLLADVQYVQFNHLSDETFKIRLLDLLGATPADKTAQAASRLVAQVTEAYQRGRSIRLRFSLSYGSPEAVPVPLERALELGALADTLLLPTGDHFTNGAFQLRVGSKAYTLGTDLIGVAVFTTPLLGDQIEYGLPGSGVEGQLRFGATTQVLFQDALVYYDETFTDPDLMAAGQAEYNAATGELNLSTPDMTAYAGLNVYFTEGMISEDRLDAVMSPLTGSFFLNRPLRAGQLVEADYYPADKQGVVSGPRIVEFLPFMVRQELATRVDAYTYTVNPTGKTISSVITPYIWSNYQLQTYGNIPGATLSGDLITFNHPQDASAVVQVNYGVLEASGGEQAFNTSTMPVWRPPFYLTIGQTVFTLEGDRTSEMAPGKLLRLGATPFYLKAATYNALSGETSVVVWPPSSSEAGSRAPGNDVLSLLTSKPVTTSVDGVATTGEAGFMLTLVNPTATLFEPVNRGTLSILFHGDVRQYTVAGHLLEMNGYPFIVVGSTLTEDGRSTQVDVSSPVTVAFNPASTTVKVSVRPIYPPAPMTFVGKGAFLTTEDYEAVLLGGGVPGRTLSPGIDYQVDANTGDVSFIAPRQSGLGVDQKLMFRHTKRKVMQPTVQDGAVIYPRYKAGYSYNITPSESGVLLSRYEYRNPDTFFYQTMPFSIYMGEFAEIAVQRVESQDPSGGPVQTAFSGVVNQDQGRFGLLGEERDLRDQDRAARGYIRIYNDAIVAFEQVLETISGGVIGDWDGKFRFHIGYNKEYPAPGDEDSVTGDLNLRFVWSQVFLAANRSFGVTEADPVVDPETATRNPVSLVVSGDAMSPHLLRYYVEQQKSFVVNDMDDHVLVGGKRSGLRLSFPLPTFNIEGDFRAMWEPHRLSRLFPEAATAFTTTYPGIQADLAGGDPGFYTWKRMINPPRLLQQDPADQPVFGSTYGKPIGTVSNPAWGVFDTLTDARPRERLPRARIWAYSADGFPDLDAVAGTTTTGYATVIATPLHISEFPVDPTTGLPDWIRLISQGGSKADLQSGDQELSTPPFQEVDPTTGVAQQVAFGTPTGDIFDVGNSAGGPLPAPFGLGDTQAPGVFVGAVQIGCVLILSDEVGNPIPGTQVVRLGTDGRTGTTLTLEQGDTILIVPPGRRDTTGMADPPNVSEQETFANNLPNYRKGFDVGVPNGQFVDLSLPSLRDPAFPIKEIVGQRTPSPLSTIEADVDFVNNEDDPFQFPALLGQDKTDSGDYDIPYLATARTELDRLGEAQTLLGQIVFTDAPAPTATQVWLAVYPDEIVGSDGAVLAAAAPGQPPATLLTSMDLAPVGLGPYIAGSGVGDVRPYDLLLVERPNTLSGLPIGATGILAVGAVQAGQIEPPRFITETQYGDVLHYNFTSVMCHVATAVKTGMTVTATPVGPNIQTTFNITSTATVFNDGNGVGATGGLNNILTGPNNVIILRIYRRYNDVNPGTLLETIAINASTCWGGLGNTAVVVPPVANAKTIVVTTAATFAANATGGGVYYDYTLTVDTYITPATNVLTGLGTGTGSGSTTGFIYPDRLTFSEHYDLAFAAARGKTTVAPGAVDISAGLSVYGVTASGVPLVLANNPVAVNFGQPLTFLPRTFGSEVVGTFVQASVPGGGDEEGTVKAMGFEGHANVSLPSTGIVFSAVPSSEVDEGGVILNGTGRAEDGDTWIHSVLPGAGLVPNVLPGDIVCIKHSSIGDAAVKAGTYLVRHALEDNSGAGYREAVFTGVAGDPGSWAEIIFPKIVSFDATTSTVDDVGYGWAAAGRVYVIVDPLDPTTVVSKLYNLVGNTFTLTAGSGQDAAGAGITDVAFAASLAIGRSVTGMRLVRVGLKYPAPFPGNNVVGYDSGVTTAGGFVYITISNTILTGDVSATAPIWDYGAGGIVVGVPGAGQIGITVPAPADSTAFYPGRNETIYVGVATELDTFGLTGALWDQIHTAGAGTTLGVRAFLPSDKLTTSSIVDAYGNDNAGIQGFRATAGVFLEPSFPRPTRNLNQVVSHVVDADVTATNTEYVGMRDANLFGLPNPWEDVAFEVRRIRRFHGVQEVAFESLAPLRFTYEIRRGVVLSYAAAGIPLPGFLLVADTMGGSATQLGDFNSIDVNIHAGDEVRLLDSAGVVVDRAEVGVVLGATAMLLRDPGFTQATPAPGDRFEIFLRTAPVPHEQSHEQLMDVVVDRVLHTTSPNYTTGAGGYVPTYNELRDSTVASFSTLGVTQGDYILVDPAGNLAGPTGYANPPESGARPIGDQSIIGRPYYIPGRPSELDDNRGFYRVTQVYTNRLVTTGVSPFSGAVDDDVVFGVTGQGFAVLPTIHDSLNPNPASLGGDTEGQQDLRTTAVANGANSYKGNAFSVQPFGYQVVRPKSLFSQETVETVFFMRERMLSWMEELSRCLSGLKSGDYWAFQSAVHITDLGSATDPDDGLGVMSNVFVASLSGLVGYSPFANVSDSLSVLDRRYWCLDYRLDNIIPAGMAVPYSSFASDAPGVPPMEAGSGRPVLPDRITDILDQGDRLRELRYAWLRIRCNRVYGTLQGIDRYLDELPKRIKDQATLARIKESL